MAARRVSVKGKGTTSRDVYISEMRVLRPNTIVTMLILLVNVSRQLVSKSTNTYCFFEKKSLLNNRLIYQPSREITLWSCDNPHSPPFGAGVREAFSVSTILRCDSPRTFMLSISGRIFSAKLSAACWRASMLLLRLALPAIPRTLPRALAAARAAFVRALIWSRSCSDITACIWIIPLSACGISAATKLIPVSISPVTKCTLRARRSSLAISKIAPCFLHAASAALSCGRLSRAFEPLPVSISSNSSTTSPVVLLM
ncbi:hypothetical protein ECP03048169_0278 [Escherichia coli P0304816.9]|nr:hypothetical protein ECP03048169_0278 [Escherichia coli P0304816.9]